jgi:hypothetical protein
MRNKMKTLFTLSALTALMLVTQVATAGPVNGLNTFTAGTPARAAEVNTNFAAVKTAVDDNNTRISTLVTQMAALQAQVTTLQTQLANVIPLNNVVSVTQVAGVTTVRLTGVNLQVVNGMGSTATRNGMGNIYVGYDEARTAGIPQCSIGRNPTTFAVIANEGTCIAAGGIWALNHKSGSHYLIVGPEQNYSRWAGIVSGHTNTSNGNYASVTGGVANLASGSESAVHGGVRNKATGDLSTVLGGEANTASGGGATVSGGGSSTASGTNATVSGGELNTASGNWSAVSGGSGRSAPVFDNWAGGSLLQSN